MGSLVTATDSLNLILSDILWSFYDSFWPDALISYDQWIQQVCTWRLAADHRIEERQLSEIRQRQQNGQQLPKQIKQGSVLTKAASSVDGCIIRVFIARDLRPGSIFHTRPLFWHSYQPHQLDDFHQAFDDVRNQVNVVRSDLEDAERALDERRILLAGLPVVPDYEHPTENKEDGSSEKLGH